MIEKVGYSRPTAATSRTGNVKRTGAVGATPFADALAAAEGVGGVEAASSVAGVAGVGALIGAQEVSEEELNRRKAVKRGRLTLDALSGLRDALLTGTLPIRALRQLEDIIAQERTASLGNPALGAILDEIELRAAVELAKLEMAGVIPPR